MQKYDEDEFIRIWNESATAHEVAERTGMTVEAKPSLNGHNSNGRQTANSNGNGYHG